MGKSKLADQNNILKGYNMLLYFAGSMIMYEPTEECLTDFWSDGILKALPVASSNPRFIEAASQLRSSCNEKKICKSHLQRDFNRLFSGMLLAPPIKSIYVDHQIYTERESVSDFYNAYGWKYRSRFSFPDDNLGIELLFITLMTDKYMAFEDEPCRSEMGKEILRFIDNHVLSWIPQWNQLMQDNAETLSYKGIASLIYACIEDIHNILSSDTGFSENKSALRN